MIFSKIIGVGSYLPKKLLTNKDLEKSLDTTDEWITSRTGIKQRHIVGPDEQTSDLAFEAGRSAITNASISPDEIDLIIVATTTPDMQIAATAAYVATEIGSSNAFGFDLQAACSGFLYAMSMAVGKIETGRYKKVLVVGADKMSSIIDYKDRSTCILFGDGAGAAVLSRCEEAGKGILSSHLHSEGKHAKELVLEGPSTQRWVPEILENNDPNDVSYYPHMNGQFVIPVCSPW